MHSPDFATSRRRDWKEIYGYYQSAAERFGAPGMERLREAMELLKKFAYLAGRREHMRSLVTVGTVGCISVFRNERCIAEDGYILIGWSQEGEILLGFYSDVNFDPAGFSRFTNATSAIDYFERCLKEHQFVAESAGCA